MPSSNSKPGISGAYTYHVQGLIPDCFGVLISTVDHPGTLFRSSAAGAYSIAYNTSRRGFGTCRIASYLSPDMTRIDRMSRRLRNGQTEVSPIWYDCFVC